MAEDSIKKIRGVGRKMGEERESDVGALRDVRKFMQLLDLFFLKCRVDLCYQVDRLAVAVEKNTNKKCEMEGLLSAHLNQCTSLTELTKVVKGTTKDVQSKDEMNREVELIHQSSYFLPATPPPLNPSNPPPASSQHQILILL